ncbi:hypothetical protein SDC9_144281 [bioreactor metagenome]|uniref:Uncharacterized protein n=1 Tax=bioreactor metagenome TaxID=1076179 RepID=A0A645E792_9ZZZZ
MQVKYGYYRGIVSKGSSKEVVYSLTPVQDHGIVIYPAQKPLLVDITLG